MWVIYIKTPKDYYLIHQLVQLTDLILKELFVTEEIPITVSRRTPDKEAWPSPYHYCS